MTKTVPYDRIAAPDFYKQIDWIREAWDDPDEYRMTQKIQRLERLYRRLPTRYYDPARDLLLDLGWCRIIAKRDWQGILRQLVEIVRDWDRTRGAASG